MSNCKNGKAKARWGPNRGQAFRALIEERCPAAVKMIGPRLP